MAIFFRKFKASVRHIGNWWAASGVCFCMRVRDDVWQFVTIHRIKQSIQSDFYSNAIHGTLEISSNKYCIIKCRYSLTCRFNMNVWKNKNTKFRLKSLSFTIMFSSLFVFYFNALKIITITERFYCKPLIFDYWQYPYQNIFRVQSYGQAFGSKWRRSIVTRAFIPFALVGNGLRIIFEFGWVRRRKSSTSNGNHDRKMQ